MWSNERSRGVGIPMLREANDEVLQRRTLRARAEIVRLARENPKCLPVSRESNCATAGESTSLVLRVGKPELVMVLLIAFSAQVLSIYRHRVGLISDDQRCLIDLSTWSSLTRTRGRPSRPGRVHSTFPLKSTTAAAMNLDAADHFNYQFSAPSVSSRVVKVGRTL